MAKKSAVLVRNRGEVQGIGPPVPPRKYADRLCEQGICTLLRALNAADIPDLPYRYSQEVIDEFQQHAVAIIGLIETGRIVERPAAYAQSDTDFQRFMARAASSPPG